MNPVQLAGVHKKAVSGQMQAMAITPTKLPEQQSSWAKSMTPNTSVMRQQRGNNFINTDGN